MSAVSEGYLRGRVAVVTGGRGGIGSAICARFINEGAIVYAADIAGDPPKGALSHNLDVTLEDSANALMERVGEESVG